MGKLGIGERCFYVCCCMFKMLILNMGECFVDEEELGVFVVNDGVERGFMICIMYKSFLFVLLCLCFW